MHLYFLCVRIAALLGHKKARKLVEGQAQALQKIREARSRWKAEDKHHADDGPIWFHAASVGEFEQARPIIERLKQEHPGKRVLLTFFSPSGYEMRKDYPVVDLVTYLPFATRRRVRAFLDELKPGVAVFVKYEFWPAYLRELKRRKIKTFLISAIFRPKQLFFWPWGISYRNLLKAFTRLYVQDEASAELLRKYGLDRVTVAGDTRFDRVSTIASREVELPLIEQFCVGKTIVAGSTWPEDETLLARYLEERDDVKLLLVPHEINAEHLHRIFLTFKGQYIRYSEATSGNIATCRVVMVDTLGLLSQLYRYATVGYVGGGYGAGIHNTIEAAVYGIPVLFGPNYYKFREAKNLLKNGAAETVNCYGSFRDAMDRAIRQHQEMGAKAKAYVASELGATSRIYEEIFQ